MPIPSDRNYLASAIMNPLECMMKSELSSDNLQRDLGNIDKVFSVDTLKKFRSVTYICKCRRSSMV